MKQLFRCVLLPILLLPLALRGQNGLNKYDGFATVRGGDVYILRLYDDITPQIIRYKVEDFSIVTRYDSIDHSRKTSPIVEQLANGQWVMISYGENLERITAVDRDSGNVIWTTPGIFPDAGEGLGTAQYRTTQGDLLLYFNGGDGLRALNIENGSIQWHIPSVAHGKKPAIDQEKGWLFYQSSKETSKEGVIRKVDALTGNVLSERSGIEPSYANNGNTILVNDDFGYYVVGFWHPRKDAPSKVVVWDKDLKEVWSRSDLTCSKATSMAYHNGQLIIPRGTYYEAPGVANLQWHDWKKITSYNIQDGCLIWECDLSAFNYYRINNIIYCNGFVYAITDGGLPFLGSIEEANRLLFRIDVEDGTLVDYLDFGHGGSAAAVPFLSHGKFMEGNHNFVSVEPVKIGVGEVTDWHGSYGDIQTNTCAAPDEAVRIPSTMRILDYGYTESIGLDSLNVILQPDSTVSIAWQTSFEKDILDFNVLRSLDQLLINSTAINTTAFSPNNDSLTHTYATLDMAFPQPRACYWLEVNYQDGNKELYGPMKVGSYTPAVIKDSTTAIGDTSGEYFDIYPNPTTGTLNLNLGKCGEVTISLVNMQGQTVINQKINTQRATIDLSTLGKGMYLVTMRKQDEPKQIIAKKIVIK